MECGTCKGRGLVRLHWKAKNAFFKYQNGWTYTDMYRDEWCKRCDGKGQVPAASPIATPK